MARVMANGQELCVPDEVMTGEEIKKNLGLPLNRNLILQRPGGNYLVHNKEQISLVDGDYFADAPTFQYG